MHALVTQAMQWGGDDPTINDPCTCAKCGGVGLPRDRRKGKRPRTWEREYWSLVRGSVDDSIEGRSPKRDGEEKEDQEEEEEEPCRKRAFTSIRVRQKANGLWVREKHYLDGRGYEVLEEEFCDLPPPAPRRALTA